MIKRLSIIIIIFMGIGLTSHAQVSPKNVPKVTEQVTKEKKSLLKRLSDALKFTKNARQKERVRIIAIIDTMLKDSLFLSGKEYSQSQKMLKDSLWAKLGNLQLAIEKIKAEQEKQRNNAIVPSGGETPPKEPEEDEKVNNDQYIESLINAILGKEKVPDPVKATERRQQLALIKKLLIEPALYKDTIKHEDKTGKLIHLFERQRTVKLKHAAEVWGFLPSNSSEIELNYRLYSAIVVDGFVLNGATGRNMNNLQLDNSELYHRTKAMGNSLILSINASSKETNTFLQSSFAQEQFTSKIAATLAANHMDGLNIQFSGVNQLLSKPLVKFISNLSKTCKKTSKKFSLNITIPAFDVEKGYSISTLSPFIDKFLIDFTQKLPENGQPLAPLKQQSDYSIETCVSRYLSAGEQNPAKFIILLPFYGIKWDINEMGKATNPDILSYSRIRSGYQFVPVTYDQQTANALIELTDSTGKPHTKIWFDDENTLGQKFDFALNDGLGGVAISNLTADVGYGELSDELAYKFLVPDTSTVAEIDLTYKNQKFGWDYIVRNLKTYFFVLGNPCHYTHDIVDRTLLSYINLILIVICAILGFYCCAKIRSEGNDWAYKKPLLIITGFMLFIFITCGFAWIYLDADIPWFGVDNECIDMPFLILYLIILIGIALGIILMRLILFPIVRQEDTP